MSFGLGLVYVKTSKFKPWRLYATLSNSNVQGTHENHLSINMYCQESTVTNYIYMQQNHTRIKYHNYKMHEFF
jgi:hypothetical protein